MSATVGWGRRGGGGLHSAPGATAAAQDDLELIFAPRLFFELANKPSTTFGVRPSGVLIMRKVWKPADTYIKAEWSSGPAPEPVR